LPFAIKVLQQVDAEKLALDQETVLVADEGITIRFSEREMTAGMGDNTATPAAMVALLGGRPTAYC
jgi:hypothetical protein